MGASKGSSVLLPPTLEKSSLTRGLVGYTALNRNQFNRPFVRSNDGGYQTWSASAGELVALAAPIFTLAALVKFDSAGAYTSPMSYRQFSDGGAVYFYKWTDDTIRAGVVGATLIGASAVDVSKWHFIVFTFVSSTEARLYLNGDLIASGACGASGSGSVYVGGAVNLFAPLSLEASFEGQLAHAEAWNRALDEKEILELSNRYKSWGIFNAANVRPKVFSATELTSYYPAIFDRHMVGSAWFAEAMSNQTWFDKRLPVVAVTSSLISTVYNETLTEIVIASDSLSNSAVFVRSLSEGALLTDSLSVTSVLVASLSEPAGAADALAATTTIVATLSEPATAGDSLANTMALNLSLTEAATAGDSLFDTTFGNYNESVTEPVTAADSLVNSAVRVASLTEAMTATDSLATTAALGVSLTEAATPADTVTAVRTMTNAISEAMTAGDSVTAAFIFAVLLSEPVTVADSLDASALISVSLTESATPSDTVTAQRFSNVALTESASAGDSLASVLIYGATVNETVSPSDSLSSTLVFGASLTEAINAVDVLGAFPIYVTLEASEMSVERPPENRGIVRPPESRAAFAAPDLNMERPYENREAKR